MESIAMAAIETRILVIRGQRVMLDSDLAEIYGVETRALVQAIKRNKSRFPDDFMFPLTHPEFQNLKSQNVMSSPWGGRRTLPYAFTEHGALMLASVLRSDRAVTMSIYVVRAFARLRELLSTHEDLRRKIEEMESRYDQQFKIVFDALRELIDPPPKNKKRIGFEP